MAKKNKTCRWCGAPKLNPVHVTEQPWLGWQGKDEPHEFKDPPGFWARVLDGLGQAIGESMFGGGR